MCQQYNNYTGHYYKYVECAFLDSNLAENWCDEHNKLEHTSGRHYYTVSCEVLDDPLVPDDLMVQGPNAMTQ